MIRGVIHPGSCAGSRDWSKHGIHGHSRCATDRVAPHGSPSGMDCFGFCRVNDGSVLAAPPAGTMRPAGGDCQDPCADVDARSGPGRWKRRATPAERLVLLEHGTASLSRNRTVTPPVSMTTLAP